LWFLNAVRTLPAQTDAVSEFATATLSVIGDEGSCADVTTTVALPAPEIVPAAEFHVAEQYHQEYYDRVGRRNLVIACLIGTGLCLFLLSRRHSLVGGSLWGMYWVVAGLFGRMHAEEAFAALRIKNYKNFLRLKFEPDKLTIYPLGIDKVPGSDGWLNAPRGKANPMPHNPKLLADRPIDVRLIENPIVIASDDTTYE